MGLRILLVVSGLVAILLGGLMLFAPESMITGFQLGAPELAGRAFARSMGGALICVGVIDLLAIRDHHSPALYAVVVGNFLLHVVSPAIDFMEPFPKEGGFWVSVALHAAFALAFGYYAITWNRRDMHAAA
jgi:hypothetical protein